MECCVGGRQHSAETRQQPHGVGLRQIAGCLVPPGDELLCILGSPETRLQFGGTIVIEAEVGGREALFQNCHPREQAHRLAFYVVGWGQQHLAISLKERPGNPAQHILGEGDGAIFQSDMNRRSVQRRFPDLEHSRGIQPDATQLQIEGLRGAGPARLRSRLFSPGWRERQNRQAHGQRHDCFHRVNSTFVT